MQQGQGVADEWREGRDGGFDARDDGGRVEGFAAEGGEGIAYGNGESFRVLGCLGERVRLEGNDAESFLTADDSEGVHASDFSGVGCAFVVVNNATAQIEDVDLVTDGFVRAALIVDNYARAWVKDSSFVAYGANPLTALPGISTGAVVQVPTALLPPKKDDVDYYKNVVSVSIGGVEVHIGFKTDVDELRDITGEVTSIIEGFTASMASAIGELTANLINGENPWMNFGNAAVSAFGDMAVAIGKIAIQAGVAALGIDAMLKTPAAGGIAIAAGVALVALGQAVKAGMANIANGNYSSSQGAYSNTTSSYGSDYEQREVYVNVTGTLQADGDALVAVINNSNKKRNLTT